MIQIRYGVKQDGEIDEALYFYVRLPPIAQFASVAYIVTSGMA